MRPSAGKDPRRQLQGYTSKKKGQAFEAIIAAACRTYRAERRAYGNTSRKEKKTMIKIEAKIDKENNQTEVSIEQEGSAVDIFAEVGGIIMALVKDVVQRVSETGEVMIGHTSMPLREETVDVMAKMMQKGFREGVNQLIEQGILRKDYMEEETC
ncbi:MAG: hypothetical protein KH042_11200 [Eubacterium limosum]|nr:hypothetical protein [Eubacterium limosum]